MKVYGDFLHTAGMNIDHKWYILHIQGSLSMTRDDLDELMLKVV
jgi:hypothetical protein